MKQRIPYWKSISFKFSLVIFSGTLAVVSFILVLSVNRQHQSAIIYQDRKVERQESFRIISDLEQQPLKGLTIENTYFDEMVSFINKPTATFENNVIRSQLDTYQASAIWTYNTKYQLVSSTNMFDAANAKYNLGLDQADLTKLFSTSYLAHFYRQTDAGVLEIYGATVHGSDDPEHKTPRQGYYFVARLLDSNFIKSLEAKTKDRIVIEPIKEDDKKKAEPLASTGVITFQEVLKDETGQGVARIEVSYRSAAIAGLIQSLQGVIIIVIACYIVITIGIYIILQKIIITPITDIYSSLVSNQYDKLTKLSSKDTELGRIAALIKKADEQKDTLADLALETQKGRDSLEMRTKELESTNALMIDRELKMIELKRQNNELQSKAQ